MSTLDAPTVTVVTGPTGVDIGPVAAWLGRDLGDGLAIRTVVSPAIGISRVGAHEHDSPSPPGTAYLRTGQPMPRVPLWNLPSAWQNPDTNLGVAYTGAVTGDLAHDIETLRGIGWDPSHRLVVSRHGGQDNATGDHRVPHPVEIGDLAEAARDSVLRAADGGSRHVLIEAGDGQTIIDAFRAVGLAQFDPSIKVLRLWLVVNAEAWGSVEPEHNPPGGPVARILADAVIGAARELAVANDIASLVPGPPGGARVTASLAVLNGHLLLPQLAGVDTHTFLNTSQVPTTDADAFNDLVTTLTKQSSLHVGWFGTGPDTFLTID